VNADEIYVTADELPKKRRSSHAAEKIIMETLASMVTEEDDDTPTKIYTVARALSKINASKPMVTKKTSDDQVQVHKGPPALPVKKNNVPERADSRRSDPVRSSTKPEEVVPAGRKFSLSSLKKKDESQEQYDLSPNLPIKKGREEKKNSTEHNKKLMAEVGKISKIHLGFGEQMIKGMAGSCADGIEKHDKPSQDKVGEEYKANVHELRQKLQDTGIPVGPLLPSDVKPRTMSSEKIISQKPDKISRKSGILFQKPEKHSQKHDRHSQKPDQDKSTQKSETSKLSVAKELLQRKRSGGAEYMNVELNRPEAAPRHRRSDSDPSFEMPKEEKRMPLPLPRGNKLHTKQEETDLLPSGFSEYSEPYEYVKEVCAQLRTPASGTLTAPVVSVCTSPNNNAYELEERVGGSDSSYSVERRTVALPKWIGDENAYAYVGGPVAERQTGTGKSLNMPPYPSFPTYMYVPVIKVSTFGGPVLDCSFNTGRVGASCCIVTNIINIPVFKTSCTCAVLIG
jgi:hypothetical protein